MDTRQAGRARRINLSAKTAGQDKTDQNRNKPGFSGWFLLNCVVNLLFDVPWRVGGSVQYPA